MIDLLAAMQIARRATEEQFSYDENGDHSRERRTRRRSTARVVSLFRRGRQATAAGSPPRASATASPNASARPSACTASYSSPSDSRAGAR